MATTVDAAAPTRAPAETDRTMLLEIRHLEVTYHRVAVAIQGVSLQVPAGAIVAVLGSNGAGKTTTLRAVGGYLPAEDVAISEGVVIFDGREITGLPPHRTAKLGIATVPERNKVFREMTVEDNLRLVPASAAAANRGAIIDLINELFPVLLERKRQLAGYLSGGERQMLGVARALMAEPKLLMVDELSLGIAPALVTRLTAAVQEINRVLGISVLLVEQNAGAALEIADYVYVMENGRVVLDGEPAEIAAHEDVKEFYLGMGGDDTTKSYAEVKQYRRKRRWLG